MAKSRRRKSLNLYIDSELAERCKKALESEALNSSLSEFVEAQLRANLPMLEVAAKGINDDADMDSFAATFGSTMLTAISNIGENMRTVKETYPKKGVK